MNPRSYYSDRRLPHRAPTAKRLASVLSLDTDTARKVRRLLDGTDDPCDVSKQAANWHRSCYNPPSLADAIMVAVDEVIGTYGVEGWADPDNYRNGVSYCNTGDTYAPTVCLIDDDRGLRWYLGSWGDLAERNVCNADLA